MLLAGCEVLDNLVTETVKLETTEFEFDAKGGSESFKFVPLTGWIIKVSDDWIEVSPKSGNVAADSVKVTITVKENTGEARSAVLDFVAGAYKVQLKVSQKAADEPGGGDETAKPDVAGNGTLEAPYSPAEANKLIWDGKNDPNAEVYVEGVISRIKEVSTKYGNATYYISEDGTATDEFYVYRGVFLNGEAFTAEDQIKVGDKVVVLGKLVMYGTNTPEMTAGGKIVSLIPGQGGTGGGNEGGGNQGGDGGETGGTAVTGWMELPAMALNTGLEYYSHHFNMNGKKYRNYTFGWSQKDLVALWVAYPMSRTYTTKNVNRTDAWAYDPALGSSKSPAPFGGYGGSYSRGHQVASADRLCCREANEQTFYGTNMTPQLNAHNSGIWENLESRVRNVANASDTTYVVTGCVVKGSKEKTVDSDGKSITVPVAYWKAVLRYEASSTTNKWACAAFYTEHRSYSGTNLKSLSMSVDELEKLVGVDFFVNLPAKVGEAEAARLEAQDPANNSVWW